jgi:hypothetical protein
MFDGGNREARQEAIKFLNLASAETGIKFLIFHGFINKDDPLYRKGL